MTPPGWREAAGRTATTAFRSVADVVDGASLVRVREFKQAAKAEKKAAAAASRSRMDARPVCAVARWVLEGAGPRSGIAERSRTGEERS